jgi:hypothetical protein
MLYRGGAFILTATVHCWLQRTLLRLFIVRSGVMLLPYLQDRGGASVTHQIADSLQRAGIVLEMYHVGAAPGQVIGCRQAHSVAVLSHAPEIAQNPVQPSSHFKYYTRY